MNLANGSASESVNENYSFTQISTSVYDDAAKKQHALVYPYDYLCPKKGTAPKTEKEATAYWQYRKDRQENSVPKGKEMLDEMLAVRESLVQFTERVVMNKIRDAAHENGLLLDDSSQKPVLKGDVRKVLKKLKQTEENELKVYKVFHKWGKVRNNIASTVDEWLKINNMRLEDIKILNERILNSKNGNRTRAHNSDFRGGFGRCCGMHKNGIVNNFMRSLLKHQGWCVCICPSQTKKNRG